MNKFAAFLADESGASAAEYVLILTIIGTALATAIGTFGGALSTALTTASTEIGKYDFAP
jgi:pilus assembly protein Flp/PilA